MKKYKIGFIGCGHMGMAIVKGAIEKGFIGKEDVLICDFSEKVKETCEEYGLAMVKDIKELNELSRIVTLAVRPQDMEPVLEQLQGEKIEVILSIVTSVSIRTLQDRLGNVPVIRAMPNTPLQLGKGSTVICCSGNCLNEDYEFIRQLFSSVGICRDIAEDRIDDAVCIHGSIPAYVYYLTQSILEDMIERGHREEDIRDLLVETIIGSGELMKKNADRPLKELIDEVCSKGGTTIEAVQEMERQQFKKIIHDANEKCINRAKQLGK